MNVPLKLTMGKIIAASNDCSQAFSSLFYRFFTAFLPFLARSFSRFARACSSKPAHVDCNAANPLKPVYNRPGLQPAIHTPYFCRNFNFSAMSHSPYTPPTSDITPRPANLPARPNAITWAVILIFLDCINGILYLAHDLKTQNEANEPGMIIVIVVTILLLVGIMAWGGMAILKGNNIARWFILVLMAIGIVMSITTSAEPDEDMMRKILDGISLVVEASILVLLNLSASRQWFRACAANQ